MLSDNCCWARAVACCMAELVSPASMALVNSMHKSSIGGKMVTERNSEFIACDTHYNIVKTLIPIMLRKEILSCGQF